MTDINNSPLYLQLANSLCDEILKDKYAAGERMPSVRDIAERVQINTNTANRTYDHLQSKGIIYKERGLGYYLSADAKEIIANMRREKFLNEQLPEIFRQMNLLKIDFKTIEEEYNKQILKNNEN